MPTFSSKDFTWDKATGVGCADASDLFGRGCPPAQFSIVSIRTGTKLNFYTAENHIRRDREGEVVAFVYHSDGHSNVVVEVIND